MLILGAAQAKAQVIKGSIDLKDSTITRSIPVQVAAGTRKVKYFVKVYLAIGNLTATLTDPNGKKAGGFTLSTQTKDGHNEPSKGELFDSESTPIPGTWKFNIKAENATGRMNYELDTVAP